MAALFEQTDEETIFKLKLEVNQLEDKLTLLAGGTDVEGASASLEEACTTLHSP